MEIQVFRHLWGIDESWETAFKKIKEAGFRGFHKINKIKFLGVDTALDRIENNCSPDKFLALLKENDLLLIITVFTDRGNPKAEDDEVSSHLKAFRAQVERAKSVYNPIKLNCQGGKDSWNFQQCVEFYSEATKITKEIGITVCFETHRGRPTFNPWQTRDLILSIPDLKLTADLSHWVCVCERILSGKEEEIIAQIAPRVLHIHARVGYEEGPQVPDPRAPEWEKHLAAHEKWWKMIWKAQRENSVEFSTVTPEYGPPDYLHTIPFTKMPVSNLWEICNWALNRLKNTFASQ